MICTQCGDLIVEDRFMDWSARWRCLRCGSAQPASGPGPRSDQRRANYADYELDFCDDEVHLGWESLVRTQITGSAGSAG
jgi:hypothetical protein